eukprot:3155711-Alexandrium_andersonii.AAC.1
MSAPLSSAPLSALPAACSTMVSAACFIRSPPRIWPLSTAARVQLSSRSSSSCNCPGPHPEQPATKR